MTTAIERLLSLGSTAPWRIITLSEKHEKFCLIDAVDWDWAQQWFWNFNYKPRGKHILYARRAVGPGRTTVYLHRELMMRVEPHDDDFYRAHVVDHINGQSLDDRRCNLRWLTQKANIANRYGEHRSPSLDSIVAGLLREYERGCALLGERELQDIPFP